MTRCSTKEIKEMMDLYVLVIRYTKYRLNVKQFR